MVLYRELGSDKQIPSPIARFKIPSNSLLNTGNLYFLLISNMTFFYILILNFIVFFCLLFKYIYLLIYIIFHYCLTCWIFSINLTIPCKFTDIYKCTVQIYWLAERINQLSLHKPQPVASPQTITEFRMSSSLLTL